MTKLDTIIERTASHIAQADYGERWYIHPLKIQWSTERDEWAYWSDGESRKHDSLESILKETDPSALKEFYANEVA
jgi:hypothetical protein